MAELEIRPTSAMLMRVAGIIVSSASLVAVLVWLLTGGGVGLFARKVELKTYMPDATGLGKGAPVRLDGIQVGAVSHIDISPYLDIQRAVRVDMKVDEHYISKIPSDSQTSVGSDTLIGDKFVDIAEGKSTEPVRRGSELRSEPQESAADKADLIFALQDSLRKVDSMLQDVASPNTPIGHYIVGNQEYFQILRSLDAFERGMRSLAAEGTPAGTAVFTTSLYSKWNASLRQIDDTMQAIQRGEGTAGRLYASDEQYNAILTQIQNLRKSLVQIRASIQKAEPGLSNDETYQKLTALLASTDHVISALNRGEGRAGELLTSPQLYESLAGSLKSLEDLLQDFNSSPRKYLRAKAF